MHFVEGIKALNEKQERTFFRHSAFQREQTGNARHSLVEMIQQLGFEARDIGDTLTVLARQESQVLIFLVHSAVGRKFVGLFQRIGGNPDGILSVGLGFVDFNIAVLLHLIRIDEADGKAFGLKLFEDGIMIVTGVLHENGDGAFECP